ncbi:unnamed protein product [Cylicostephanus goldi]|uniref:Large ribosomal subunit protein mL43 n=1 Tax=Cylicostephanus goldi TaxID=71465 RepID=A0A3P7MT74_CYLGO|nr:unnamed protein product [Cylicostephanus goldi]
MRSLGNLIIVLVVLRPSFCTVHSNVKCNQSIQKDDHLFLLLEHTNCRITFRFCKQSEGSVGVRNFIENKLISLGQQNPSVVIYTQPVRNANPTIRAEYGNGRIVQLNAKNMSMADVERDVNLLYSRSGEPVVKLESRQSSPTPSIQGEWTPVTWLPPRMNKAELPDPEFSKHKTCNVTATEYLLEEQKRNENQ